MKVVNVKANVFDGYAVTVTIKGDVQEYAFALLSIFNNVRVSKKLISVENNNGNDIIVNCAENELDYVKGWLEQFGMIKCVEKVLFYQMQEPDDYDIDKYFNCIAVPYFE